MITAGTALGEDPVVSTVIVGIRRFFHERFKRFEGTFGTHIVSPFVDYIDHVVMLQMYFSYMKAIQLKNFPAHGCHQRHFKDGKVDAGRNQVNSLRMVENALAGLDWFAVEDAAQSGGYSKRQLVRSGLFQTDGQAALCVCIKKQDFLSVLLQGDAQVDAGSGFADAAFLADVLHSTRTSDRFGVVTKMGEAHLPWEMIDPLLQDDQPQIPQNNDAFLVILT